MNKKKITISYIVPTYNSSQTIFKSTYNLLNSIDQCDELIVINDGSNDDTESELKKICGDNFKLISYKKNMGVSFARNKGIKISTKDYICFIDSDDHLISSYFREIKNELEESGLPEIYKFLNVGNYHKKIKHDRLITKRDDFTELYKNSNLLNSSCSQLIKVNLIKDNNIYFDEKISFGEDLLFTNNLLNAVNTYFLSSREYYEYSFSPQGLSKSADRDAIFRRICNINDVYDKLIMNSQNDRRRVMVLERKKIMK